MLFMVALLTMVFLVVRFMLVLVMLLVLQFGTVELLYHMTSYYTMRGGRSSLGVYCGAFFVIANATASNTHWSLGAALSFKLDIII